MNTSERYPMVNGNVPRTVSTAVLSPEIVVLLSLATSVYEPGAMEFGSGAAFGAVKVKESLPALLTFAASLAVLSKKK